MIVSFFGHYDFQNNGIYEKRLLSLIEKIDAPSLNFYLGGYGNFDNFTYSICKNYKVNHNCKLVYITPYLNKNLQDYALKYDEIIYPALENVPLKYSIVQRNKWIVDKSDYIFFYVSHTFGGAYRMLEYAKRKGKPFLNLYDYKP